MDQRCIFRIKPTMATEVAQLRRSVGGFVRYITHRDQHRDQPSETHVPDRKLEGFVNYVAFRDRSRTSSRARLFGPNGKASSRDGKAFSDFVVRSVGATQPRCYRDRKTGQLIDSRRALHRIVLSPSVATGLDLDALTRSVISRLEELVDARGIRWIAAEHRNTRHPHVHLLIAGMRELAPGQFRAVEIRPKRLAELKAAVALEMQRQRPLDIEHTLKKDEGQAATSFLKYFGSRRQQPVATGLFGRSSRRNRAHVRAGRAAVLHKSVLRLRTLAARYRSQMERDQAAEQYRLQRRWMSH